MADPISVTGKWLLSDGRIVEKEPVEGRLLVAVGSPITPDVKASIERAEAEAPVNVDEPVVTEDKPDEDVEKATESEVDNTSTAPRKRQAR